MRKVVQFTHPRERAQRPWPGRRRKTRVATRLLVLALVGGGAFALFLPDSYSGTGHGQADPIVGRASVIDGDTIEIHGRRIRLHGIDAPEIRQPCESKSGKSWRCGRQASDALSDKLGMQTIVCRVKGRDGYGRILGVCEDGGEDLNGWMVSEGWAVAYTRYSFAYLMEETAARFADRGIWAGDFMAPERWRRLRVGR